MFRVFVRDYLQYFLPLIRRHQDAEHFDMFGAFETLGSIAVEKQNRQKNCNQRHRSEI